MAFRFGTMSQMTEATNAVLLYAVVFLLAATVVTLSLALLKLTWRSNRAETHSNLEESPQTEDRKKATEKAEPLPPMPFTSADYPPPKDKLHYRIAYEPIGTLAKKTRIRTANDRQNIRIALSGLASKDTYVFEDLMTEQGPIDFLTLSRSGIHVVQVNTDEGYVWRDTATNLIHFGDEAIEFDPKTGEQDVLGDPLTENPDTVITEVTRSYKREVGTVPGETAWKIYCFTAAEIFPASEYANDPKPLSTLIDLTYWIDWKDESEFVMSEDRLHELAEVTEEVYSRKPIVTPLEVESGP